jgi:hypothetical protein
MSFDQQLEQIKETGRKRLIEILKILIHEYPRLEKGLFSENHQLQRKTKAEVLYIVDVIEKELKAVSMEEKKPSFQIWQEVFLPQNFTISELDVLKKAIEIFQQQSQKIIKPNSKPPNLRHRGNKV